MIRVRQRSSFLPLAGLVLLAGASLAGCGGNPAPDEGFVDFLTDVQPLLNARCIRCHGAGGTLNGDPDVTSPIAVVSLKGKPTGGFLDCYGDRGDCSGGGVDCRRGFRFYADDNPAGHALANAWLPSMPPGPSQKLTERESQILHRWLAKPSADPASTNPNYTCP
jgi:hypothetical protein